MNVHAVLEWIKANVFIVVFIALMIAAPIAMFFVSGSLNEGVRKEVKDRASKAADLNSLSNSEIPNEESISRYETYAKVVSADAAAVRDAAVKHNRRDRGVIRPDILPTMPENQKNVLPEKFHQSLLEAYDKLMAEVKAGTPPPAENLRQSLELSRSMFITQDLKKDSSDKLEADDEARVAEHLGKARMALYAEAADKIGMYMAPEALHVPEWSRTHLPSPGELYRWQWQLWITQDILGALHSVNAESPVRYAPVKHVLNLSIDDLPRSPDAADANSNPNGPPRLSGAGAGGGGFGGGGDPSAAPADPSAAPAAPAAATPVDPKAPAPLNYAASFTGRVSNPLYDVVNVTLDVVVETRKLPQVIDALAKYNFMTVTALDLSTTNPFAAAANGHLYGGAGTSTVRLKVETIWLREWTKQFMPQSVKDALGVAADASTAAAAPTSTS